MDQKKLWWFLLAIKTTLIICSVLIIILSILTDTNIIKQPEIEKCKIGWPIAIIVGLLYSMIPFSVKTGVWTSSWIIIIACFAFYFIMAISLQTQSVKIGQFYLLLFPHLLILITAISWLILTSVVVKTEK